MFNKFKTSLKKTMKIREKIHGNRNKSKWSRHTRSSLYDIHLNMKKSELNEKKKQS